MYLAGFVCLQPFLKESRERRAVDDGPFFQVTNRYLSVAGEWQLGQIVLAPAPAGQYRQLVYPDFLAFGVAGKEVIHTERLVRKILRKVLRSQCADC